MRIKEKINPLFEDWSEWLWDNNLQHWTSVSPDGKNKAIVWCDNLSAKSDAKISKSSNSDKIFWDGIITGIKGGPDPSPKPGPILYWLRKAYENK